MDIAANVRIIYGIFGWNFFSFTKEEFETGVAELIKTLKVVDNHLKSSKFLAGEHLSIADITLVCDLANAFKFVFTESERKALPNLTEYFYRLAAKPEF